MKKQNKNLRTDNHSQENKLKMLRTSNKGAGEEGESGHHGLRQISPDNKNLKTKIDYKPVETRKKNPYRYKFSKEQNKNHSQDHLSGHSGKKDASDKGLSTLDKKEKRQNFKMSSANSLSDKNFIVSRKNLAQIDGEPEVVIREYKPLNKDKSADNHDLKSKKFEGCAEVDKEQGVWIVYDLEANRKIQELLIKNSFRFRFDPSLDITNRYMSNLEGDKVFNLGYKKSVEDAEKFLLRYWKRCPDYSKNCIQCEFWKDFDKKFKEKQNGK